MKLRKIELHGFKSFRTKVGFEIGEGITAIVGPNGCGKSNIVDAIRWAMGTQSARALRGSEMADVIFAGSGQRKPSGLAEVVLTFENTTRRLSQRDELASSPLRAMVSSAATLTVGRSLSRSGESNYLVNGGPVRLKDVHELFLGTGASVQGYSVIEQGEIEFLVNARPSERRTFVEELAGVTRYRFHRRETQAKLQSTEQNLERLQDLLDEVLQRIAQLRRQARVAERHTALSERKRELNVRLLMSERANAFEQEAQAAAVLRASALQRNARQSEIAAVETALERLESAATDCAASVRAQTEEIYRLRAKSGLLEQGESHAQAERRALNAEHERLKNDEGDLGEERQQLRHRLDRLDDELAAERERPQGTEELEGRLAEAEVVAQSTERVLDRLDADLRRSAEQLAQQQATVSTYRDERARLHAAIDERAARRGELASQLKEKQGALRAAKAEHAEHERELERLSAEQQRATETVAAVRAAVHAAHAESEPVEQQLTACKARHLAKSEALAEIGKAGGLAVLEAGEAGRLDGVIGLVGSGIVSPSGYDRTVHGALGRLFDYVVVADAAAAEAAIAFARANDLVMGCIEQNAAVTFFACTTDSLLEVVEVADWVPAPVRRVLGQSRLVEGLAGAEVPPAGQAIDHDGACRAATGVWCTPDPTGSESTRQARLVREIGALDREAATHGERRQALRQQLAECQARLHDAVQRESKLADALERRRAEAVAGAVSISQLEGQVDGLAAQLADRERAHGAEERRLSELERLIRCAAEAVEQERRQLAQAEQAREEARKRRDVARSELASLQDALSQQRARLLQHTERVRAIGEERRRAEDRIGRSEGRLERLALRRREIADRQQQIAEQVAADRQKARDVAAKLVVVKGDLDRAKERADSLRRALAERTKEAQTIRQHAADAAAEAERVSGVRNQARRDIERLEAILAQQYGIGRQEVANFVEGSGEGTEDGTEDAATALDRVESQLATLGPVNHAAIGELNEAEGRHAFLCEQRGDLNRAIADMRATVHELDRASRAELLSTFQALRAQFEDQFTRLFQGGEATLALTDESDPLNAGVEVFVRPPGKKVRSMSLLSGGEKALTAIALVFAAFRLKPSPFCVLDEVDAPLDDANVERFVSLIRELSAETQLLVVTHNRRTMEGSDRLVGVTMDDPGCSRLVGVQVPRSAEELPGVRVTG